MAFALPSSAAGLPEDAHSSGLRALDKTYSKGQSLFRRLRLTIVTVGLAMFGVAVGYVVSREIETGKHPVGWLGLAFAAA